MRNHASAQQVGGRPRQCDATTARHTPSGARAFVLLDGIGSTEEVQRWTRRQAMRLAASTTRLSWPAEAIRRQREENTAEREVLSPWAGAGEPSAVAVAALWSPADRYLEIAWCGDARAYLLHPDGRLQRFTTDHNGRQAAIDMGLPPLAGTRHYVLSHLGDEDGPIGSAYLHAACGRLLLCSDGLYEPIEDSGRSLAPLLDTNTGPAECAQRLARLAVRLAGSGADNATCLIADLPPA